MKPYKGRIFLSVILEQSIKTIEFLNWYLYFIGQEMIFQVPIGRLQSAIITTASQLISILSMMSENISKQHL